MKTIEEKAQEYFDKNDCNIPTYSGYAFMEGVSFAIPLAKEEGFRLAIKCLETWELNRYAFNLDYEGIRLGILTDPGDKK